MVVGQGSWGADRLDEDPEVNRCDVAVLQIPLSLRDVEEVLAERGRRNKRAAIRMLPQFLKRQGYVSDGFATDCLLSYSAALDTLRYRQRHRPGRLRENNRVEHSHLGIRRRECKMQLFKSQVQAQCFAAIHGAIYNHLNAQRHLVSRSNSRQLPGHHRHGGMDSRVS